MWVVISKFQVDFLFFYFGTSVHVLFSTQYVATGVGSKQEEVRANADAREDQFPEQGHQHRDCQTICVCLQMAVLGTALHPINSLLISGHARIL